jgi:hypothetical protein
MDLTRQWHLDGADVARVGRNAKRTSNNQQACPGSNP